MGAGQDALLLDALAGSQGQLQAEKLVKGQAAAGLLLSLHGMRKVNLVQGPGQCHEPVIGHDLGRKEVRDVTLVSQGAGDDTPHPGGRDSLAGRVHRQYAGQGLRSLAAVEFLHEGGLHLLEAVGKGDLAREGHLVAALQLVGNPGLAKEGDLHDARGVRHVDLGNLQTGTGPLERDLVHRALDRGLHAQVGMRDVRQVREVQIAMGHM